MSVKSVTKTATSSPRDQESLWDVRWRWDAGPDAAGDAGLVQACSDLFSRHYGLWGELGHRPGDAVEMSPQRVKQLLDDDAAWLASAHVDGALVGYCIAVRTSIPGRGPVAWVSQMVVHTTYRNAKIATRLLYSIWQFSDCYAWGLATANPFAVRALETATRRPCRSSEISRRGPEVLLHISAHVPYLPEHLVVGDDARTQPRVDTKFYLDHSSIPAMRQRAARADRPWGLGDLADGQEWFACTFAEQEPQGISNDNLDELLTGADDIWIQAYEGMTLDESHRWRSSTADEVATIVSLSGIKPGARVLDLGCGDGRHAAELARAAFQTTAVDISGHLISQAREKSAGSGARFEVHDARKGLPDGEFDLIVALYDVLGSSARSEDDALILTRARERLRAGGYLIATVMNSSSTFDRIPATQKPETNMEFVEALEALRPSSTMESTGSVFDPELLLVYRGVYYRKEQFQLDHWRLPTELVVRDRRFTVETLCDVAASAGFDVLEVRPVQSGAWSRSPTLDPTDARAKELLLVARVGIG